MGSKVSQLSDPNADVGALGQGGAGGLNDLMVVDVSVTRHGADLGQKLGAGLTAPPDRATGWWVIDD